MSKIITDSDTDSEKMAAMAAELVTTNGALNVLLRNAYTEIAKIENATWDDWKNILKSIKSKFNL